MNVTINISAPLSLVTGNYKILLPLKDGATADDLLNELRRRYPDFDEGVRGKGLPVVQDYPFYRLIVNSALVPWDEAAAVTLHDGDTVNFFLPYSGG